LRIHPQCAGGRIQSVPARPQLQDRCHRPAKNIPSPRVSGWALSAVERTPVGTPLRSEDREQRQQPSQKWYHPMGRAQGPEGTGERAAHVEACRPPEPRLEQHATSRLLCLAMPALRIEGRAIGGDADRAVRWILILAWIIGDHWANKQLDVHRVLLLLVAGDS